MKRTLLCIAVLALTLITSVSAQDRAAVSFEQLAVGATAAGLSASTLQPQGQRPPEYCRGIVQTGDVRIRVDGTVPTSASGEMAQAGAVVEVVGGTAVTKFSAIRVTSTSGDLAITCYKDQPTNWRGALVITPPVPGVSTTGTGASVQASSPALVTPTIAGATLSGTLAGNAVLSGSSTVTGRWFVRDDFDQGYFVHQDDMTAKSLTDAENNVVFGSPLGLISYREELGKTTSSWTIDDGKLDIKGDNTTNDEGVEIVFGGNGGTTTEGVIVAGTTGACFTASITNTDISGTDQFLIGWRQNETWTDVAAYAGYTVWTMVGVNNVDGSIFSLAEVSGATQSDDSGVNMADGETRLLKSCVSAAGVFSNYYTASGGTTFLPITMTNSGLTATAGVQMYPFLSFMTAGTDGPNPLVNWVQLEAP